MTAQNGGSGWNQNVISLIGLVFVGAGLLTGATLWIDSTIRATADASMAAINGQAAVFARTQSELDHRVTVLEAEHIESGRANDRLINEVEQLRSTEGDLTTAIQRLNDLMPERKK